MYYVPEWIANVLCIIAGMILTILLLGIFCFFEYRKFLQEVATQGYLDAPCLHDCLQMRHLNNYILCKRARIDYYYHLCDWEDFIAFETLGLVRLPKSQKNKLFNKAEQIYLYEWLRTFRMRST